MNKDLFIQEEHNSIYNKQGFIHIPNFLSSEELELLRGLYHKKEKSFFDKGFHRTLDLKNFKKKKEIYDGIASIVTPKGQQNLKDYRMLLTSFMTKEKKADAFDIHQNWTFVEEDNYTSLVIWIPLQDVDSSNGGMSFIPGSDQWDKGIRGNNIIWQYESQKDKLLQDLIPLPMNAGDAVIFDDATIHYTSPNTNKKPRIAIAQVMIPEAAQPIFYNLNLQTKQLEKYAISDNFYLTFTDKYLKGDFSEMTLVDTI